MRKLSLHQCCHKAVSSQPRSLEDHREITITRSKISDYCIPSKAASPEGWGKVDRHVFVPLLKAVVLANVVQVIPPDYNSPLHLHLCHHTWRKEGHMILGETLAIGKVLASHFYCLHICVLLPSATTKVPTGTKAQILKGAKGAPLAKLHQRCHKAISSEPQGLGRPSWDRHHLQQSW